MSAQTATMERRMNTIPTNTNDTIDSRDVIARIEELREDLDSIESELIEVLKRASELFGKDAGDFGGTDGLVEYLREHGDFLSTVEGCEEESLAHRTMAGEVEDAATALAEWHELNDDELKALEDLAAEASDCPDWEYGATLVRDTYFKEFAMDEADDIYDIKFNRWPYTCIDWEQAAEELQQDYMQVDFDGVTYWVRA